MAFIPPSPNLLHNLHKNCSLTCVLYRQYNTFMGFSYIHLLQVRVFIPVRKTAGYGAWGGKFANSPPPTFFPFTLFHTFSLQRFVLHNGRLTLLGRHRYNYAFKMPGFYLPNHYHIRGTPDWRASAFAFRPRLNAAAAISS